MVKPIGRMSFNSSIVVEGRSSRLSSNAGALLLREADDNVGLTRCLATRVGDDRDGGCFSTRELLRTLIYLPAQGWPDLDDADVLRHDPVLRLATSDRGGVQPLASEKRGLPSQPTLSRALQMLASDENRQALDAVMRERAIAVRKPRPRAKRCVVDVDSLPIEVHGHQEGSAYNGHYRQSMYHPLLATFGDDGDFIGIKLRPGNVHTADGVNDFLGPILDDLNGARIADRVLLRVDAGFPCQEFFDLVASKGATFVARLKNNPKLDAIAQPLLKLPVGRPPKEPRTFTHELTYKAVAWTKEMRAVLVVQEPAEGELFLNHFWLVTDVGEDDLDAADLVALYRQRGLAEARFGDFMSTLEPRLSSTRRMNFSYRGQEPRSFSFGAWDPAKVNEARLLLFALAANLMRAVQRAIMPAVDDVRGLRRLKDRVLRIAARIVVHARGVAVVLEAALGERWTLLLDAVKREAKLA